MTKKQQHLNKKTGLRHKKIIHVDVRMYDSKGFMLKQLQTGKPVIFALQKEATKQPWARIVFVKKTDVYDMRAGRTVGSSESQMLVDRRGKILYSFNFQLSGFGVRVGSDLTNENGVVPQNIINFLNYGPKEKGC